MVKNNFRSVVRPVQFNKEEKYTYKSDMRGTDIYYLSGIKAPT